MILIYKPLVGTARTSPHLNFHYLILIITLEYENLLYSKQSRLALNGLARIYSRVGGMADSVYT